MNADLYGHIGIVGADQGASLLKLILDAEAVSYLKRIKNGFKVNDETIGLDVIKDVGIGGNYLLEKHTIKHLKTDYWKPINFNRDSYSVWAGKQKKRLDEKCREYMEHILKNHEIDFIDKDIEKEIDKIVKSAKENLKE